LKGQYVSSGVFGVILEKSVATQSFVAKVQERNVNTEEIEDIVKEVAISKLCSMFEVGPAVEMITRFDVVVYADAMEFNLEKDQPLF
jgi:hypothetical protein